MHLARLCTLPKLTSLRPSRPAPVRRKWPRAYLSPGRLVEAATKLRATLGDKLFEDRNLFRERVDGALKKIDLKLPIVIFTSTVDGHRSRRPREKSTHLRTSATRGSTSQAFTVLTQAVIERSFLNKIVVAVEFTFGGVVAHDAANTAAILGHKVFNPRAGYSADLYLRRFPLSRYTRATKVARQHDDGCR
jgi:hypothetical protein